VKAPDRDALNAERELAEAEVKRLGDEFSRGYKQVEFPQEVYVPKIGLAEAEKPLHVLENYEIMGTGESREEAIEDWKAALHRVPASGRFFVWRVPPETAWTVDFVKERVIWRVYARFFAK